MPSAPIAPHLFPRLIITSLFPAHPPLPPTLSGTVGRVMGAVISTGRLLPAALSSSHFSLSQAWVFPRLCSPSDNITCSRVVSMGFWGTTCCTVVSLLGAWSTSFSHLSVTGLILMLFSSLITAVRHCALSQVSFPRSAVTVPWGGGMELSGPGCVHPRAALGSPHRGLPCTLSWAMPGQWHPVQ